jgi:hypothetical protein
MIAATHKPLRRKVDGGRLGILVVEITARSLVLRPLRARRPLLEATYGEIVHGVLLARPTGRRQRRGSQLRGRT